jgi:alpha-galactosidase
VPTHPPQPGNSGWPEPQAGKEGATMANVKIAIIGAGSGCFSIGLIRELCLTANLHGSAVTLMDIDRERLDAAHSLCVRYAQEQGADLRVEKTPDRAEALRGADFVINTALTAPHERLREGWKIAQKHGFRWGGSYHVMYDEAFWINFYQFRFFESITEDILSICPNAWHLLVANPVISGITHLTRKYPSAKVVGLCHGYADIYWIAKALGMEREGLTYEIPGVNHFIWLTDARRGGESLFDRLDRWIGTEAGEYWEKNGPGTALSRKRVEMYRTHGAFAVGDTMGWTGASWPWWFHSDDETEKRYAEDPWIGWNGYFESVRKNAEMIRELQRDASIRVSEKFPPVQSAEPMIPVVESIACDIPRVFIVNIQNNGSLVQGLPEDFEAEVPALVSGRGVQGIRTNPLPKSILAHTLRDRVAPVEMELEAFARGSRALLTELVLMDKWAVSMRQADAMIGEIFAMPRHEELRNHYR